MLQAPTSLPMMPRATVENLVSATHPFETRRRKVPLLKAPQKRFKRVKIDIDYDLAAPAPRDGSLSTADFDQSE
jgi:hypothetical protein